MYAAGLTLKPENVPLFQEKFERVVSEQIKPEQLVPQVDIDTTINFDAITPKFFRVLKQFKPFGPEDMLYIIEQNVPPGNESDDK